MKIETLRRRGERKTVNTFMADMDGLAEWYTRHVVMQELVYGYFR